MKRLLLIPLLLLAALPLGAQSGILASSRYVDWTKAGLPPTLPDSETTTNPYTPPTRTQCGSTIASGASVATINAALAACAHGTYVLLGPGTFTVNTGSGCYANSNTCIELYNNSGVTLRGSGPQSTTIALSNYGEINFGVTWNNSVVNVTSGLSQGSTSIVIPSITGAAGTLVVGQLLQFNQCDSGYSGTPCTGSSTDNGGLYVCGDNNACQIGSDTGNNNHQIQVSRVTAISGSGPYTITFSPALYMPNWTTASTANVTWSSSTSGGGTAEPYGNALEDLTVYVTSSSANEAVYLGRTYSSWVKGVRFVGGAQSNDISFFGCLSCLVSNNYFFSDIALDALYPPPVQESGATLDLLLNNIMASGVPWEGDGSNVANVNAFNYGRDTFTAYNENQPFDHHAGSSFDLHEGEVNGPSLPGDNTWGTHNLDTYFRNYVETFDTPYITALNNPRGMQLDNWQRFINLVGNSIGPGPASNPLTTYQASSGTSLFSFSFGSSDSLTLASSLRWGNSDSVTNTTRFVSSEIPTSLSGNAAPFSNPVPSTHNLPCSFFLSGFTGTTCTPTYSGGTGLSFWKVCKTWTTFPTACATTQTQPFPPVGPDITSGPHVNGTAYYNPAVIAWQYLPIDPTYQNSYTITGSSWSGGAETLTVSSLPNTTHLMGGFQTSGVTSACLPSGIINGEIMMTGSSTTTVTYALAANPGVSCTGTMKFPDVREFDERVYETDSGGSTVATPTFSPTSLTAPGWVTISTSTPAATCYYTVNGSTPTTSSPSAQYLFPYWVGQTQTLKAICSATGLVNSAVGTQTYSFTSPKTRFSLSRSATSQSPSPFPQDDRSCCQTGSGGTFVYTIEPTRGTYDFAYLNAWMAQDATNGSTFTFTYQGFPAWMTGQGSPVNYPPTDLSSSGTCQAPLAGVVTTDCSIKEFTTSLVQNVTGLSSAPASPVNCPNLDYVEPMNEFNTDSSNAFVGWTGTYAQLATMADDIATIVHTYCSNTKVLLGSTSSLPGFHSNGAAGDYDTATLALAQLVTPNLFNGVSFHNYSSAYSAMSGNVSPTPFPTTLASHSDSTCTTLNTPNSKCYVAEINQVGQIKGSAVLQNAAIVPFAGNWPVYVTEGGYGQVAQLNGGASAQATSYSITSNVATVIAPNSFTNGQTLLLQNFSTASYFNGQTVTVLSTGLSSSQFEFNFTHANVGSTSDTGVAVDAITTTALRTGWISEFMLLVAQQNPVDDLMYLAFDTSAAEWGVYQGSPTVAWNQAYLQTSSWLSSVVLTGAATQTPVSGGSVWTLPCTLASAACQFAWFDGWYPATTTFSTAFTTQQNIQGAYSSTAGSVTLSQTPLLLTNQLTLTVATTGTGTGTITNVANCATGTDVLPAGSTVTCSASPAAGSTFIGWSGACSGTGSCSFTLTASATVTATFSLTVAAPTFSPGAGSYATSQSVTISDLTSVATLCYTTDGTTPAATTPGTCSHGTTYSAPVTVASSLTLKALGTLAGYVNSTVSSAAYVINGQAATPTFSPAAGSYGPAQSITIASTTVGATLCFTTDGSTPTANGSGTCTHGTTYSAPVTVSTSLTLQAVASEAGFTDSAVGSAAYTINGAAATPTFSPAAGTYTSAQSVTISDSTSGSTIYYTLDGSTPTTSSPVYTAVISVATTTTVKAIATATGYLQSAVGTAAYTITAPGPTLNLSGKTTLTGTIDLP